MTVSLRFKNDLLTLRFHIPFSLDTESLSETHKYNKAPSNPSQFEQQQPGDNNVPANILGTGVLDKLYAAVFYLMDAKGNPSIGTGYCVSENTAVSPAHNFQDNEEGTNITSRCGRPHVDQAYNFVLDFIDRANDFAILVLGVGDEASCSTFLNQSHISLEPGVSYVLAAFQIGLHNDLKDLNDKLSVDVFPASIAKAHDCHFVYLAPSSGCASGGAIILQNGSAIGIHIETLNQA